MSSDHSPIGTRFVKDRQIYEAVIQDALLSATDFVWIATSDIKDLHVHTGIGRKMVPLLARLSDLIERSVSVRLIHAKEPGPRFREDFDRFPALYEGMERMLCPRSHFKCVVVDGSFIYLGSANLTGAGMGAKSDTRRNFESGIISDDPTMVDQVMTQFDEIWIGHHCRNCGRRDHCDDYKDIVGT